MQSNVGGIDRVLRIVIGALLVALAVIGTLGPWAWIGLVPLATGVFGFCPLYRLIGLSSCPLQRK
jgi:hypothetical protein